MVVLRVTILLTLKLRIGEGVRLPNYIPTLQVNPGGRNDIVESYFRLGFDYTEILMYLVLFHGISLSLRQLKRVLKSKGLGRRRNSSDIREICQVVEEELRGSGSNIGYRQMTRRLVNDYGLIVDRETVRELLKILDPEGVELRAKRSLKRRQYRTKGPNFLWHIDGYDKLKPFGFCIHGAIEGLSRQILWLDVGFTNNDPSVIDHSHSTRQVLTTLHLITVVIIIVILKGRIEITLCDIDHVHKELNIYTNFLLCTCRENHKPDILKEDYANLAGTKQYSVDVLSLTEVLMTHDFQSPSLIYMLHLF